MFDCTLVFVVAFDVAFGVAFGVTFGVTFGVAFGVTFGVTFGVAFGIAFGELKIMAGFVPSFASRLDKEKPLGIIAAVESGVVLILVVVVKELRVAQVTEHVTGGVNVALISSACITTSGLILFSAEIINKKDFIKIMKRKRGQCVIIFFP